MPQRRHRKYGKSKRYDDYMASSAWAEKRRAYKAERLWACCVCGLERPDLHLHHITYIRLGKERLDDLIPMCADHHAAAHRLEKQGKALSLIHLLVPNEPIESVVYVKKPRSIRPKKQKRAKTTRVLGVVHQPDLIMCSECSSWNDRKRLRCVCGEPIKVSHASLRLTKTEKRLQEIARRENQRRWAMHKPFFRS